MVFNFSLLYFSLFAILQLQSNNCVESRSFILDDLKDFAKAQARPRENELQKYITSLTNSLRQGNTAHLTSFDNIILELFLHSISRKKLTINKLKTTKFDAQKRAS